VTRFPILFLLAAAPVSPPTPPIAEPWTVELSGPADEIAPALLCARTGDHALECVDLNVFLRARDAQRELERLKQEQRNRWRSGGAEL
jgi:hypothetical protein